MYSASGLGVKYGMYTQAEQREKISLNVYEGNILNVHINIIISY